MGFLEGMEIDPVKRTLNVTYRRPLEEGLLDLGKHHTDALLHVDERIDGGCGAGHDAAPKELLHYRQAVKLKLLKSRANNSGHARRLVVFSDD